MFTGKRPTDERFKEDSSLHSFVKEALPERVIEITDPTLLQERVGRGTRNGNNMRNESLLQCLNSIFEIGLTCSSDPPSERIDMGNVVAMLCSIRDKLHQTRFVRHVRT
ncbi:hypothetical protein GQ457_14G025670 [Hibiscus cannabinus]